MNYEDEVNFFKAITDNMCCTFRKKRHDYGPSTTETFEKFGPVSMLVRMHDKIARLDNMLCGSNASYVEDESIKDTLLDLANYAVITLLEIEKVERKYKVEEGNTYIKG